MTWKLKKRKKIQTNKNEYRWNKKINKQIWKQHQAKWPGDHVTRKVHLRFFVNWFNSFMTSYRNQFIHLLCKPMAGFYMIGTSVMKELINTYPLQCFPVLPARWLKKSCISRKSINGWNGFIQIRFSLKVVILVTLSPFAVVCSKK